MQGRVAWTDHEPAAHGGGVVADTSLSYRTSRMVVVSRSVVVVAVAVRDRRVKSHFILEK